MNTTRFLLLFLVQLCSISMANAHTNIATDQAALLALKSDITSDPQNILVSWSTSTSICNWVGVTCDERHLRVSTLNLSYMGLTGTIPPKLGNLSFLIELRFSNNSFHGTLPQELARLRHLKLISFGYNNFMGTIPSWFGSFPKLHTFNLYGNRFSGSIPTSIYNLSSLQVMNLNNNQLSGIVPREIRNLTKLKEIYLDNNNFKGTMPDEIGNLSNLTVLNLGYNQLSGSIPTTVGRLKNLKGLYLNDNKLQGYITNELCHLDSLADLLLGGNQLSGSIPSCLGNLGALRRLSLRSNLLNSTIPSSLWGLAYILHINLSSNSLTGSLSQDIGNLKVVIGIDLSNNRFSGIIPSSIEGLENLVDLSLANNNLEGPIPSSFGNLLSLEFLDLSKNNLSGMIPKSLEALLHLKYLNLSFNSLQGEIPTGGPFHNFSAQSFMSNAALCGAPRLPACENSTIKPYPTEASASILKYIIPGILLAMLLGTFISLFILGGKRNMEVTTVKTMLPQLQCRKVSYQELQIATNGFSESNLLGTGTFGSVYKGTLPEGMEVAVKVFNLQLEGAFKSFDSACEMLSNVRHRNLIKIISSCDEMDFKASVLNYMPNGSLERWLYYEKYCSLNIFERLNIMTDVASALEYLHHGYSIPIVHCDLKPSNILLDDDMVAHVADFGIAELLGGGDSMIQTMTLATIGYMAPEYGREGIVSTGGDVYSFGIVVMETFTKRKPTDEMFVEEMNLKQWVANSLSTDAIVEVVDANLLGTEEDNDFETKRDCLSSIMRLALTCSAESPEERMNMQDAIATLNKIKMKLLKDAAGSVQS